MDSTDNSGSEPSAANLSWATTGIFTIAAMMGLWWAQIQQESIQDQASSTLEQPTGQWVLWSITLVAVGACFGLAIASGSGWRKRIPTSALVWGAVPLAMVLAFHLWLGQVIQFPLGFIQVLVGVQMQVASAIGVGAFLAALMVPALPETQTRVREGA